MLIVFKGFSYKGKHNYLNLNVPLRCTLHCPCTAYSTCTTWVNYNYHTRTFSNPLTLFNIFRLVVSEGPPIFALGFRKPLIIK